MKQSDKIDPVKQDIATFPQISKEDLKLYTNTVKLINIGNYTAAIKILEDLCKRFPFNSIFLKTLASCFQNQEKYQAAIIAYRTAHMFMPDSNIDCIYFCGICYYKLQRYNEAKIYFKKFIENKNINEIYKKRALLYFNKIESLEHNLI